MACYKMGPSSCQGRSPTTNKTATVLTTAKNLVMSPRGTQHQD